MQHRADLALDLAASDGFVADFENCRQEMQHEEELNTNNVRMWRQQTVQQTLRQQMRRRDHRAGRNTGRFRQDPR